MFGRFQKIRPIEYPLNFITLPENLATAELTYDVTTDVRSEKVRQYNESFNSSSKKEKCKAFPYSPSDPANRRFDPDRTYVKKGSGNKRGKLKDVKISTTGVSFRLCAKRKWTDKGNGYRHAKVYIVETWDTPATEKATVSKPLGWTDDVILETEGNASNLLVTVKTFDGRSSKSFTSGGADGYVRVEFDSDANRVILKPQVPDLFKDL